jgi:hypothetical protein
MSLTCSNVCYLRYFSRDNVYNQEATKSTSFGSGTVCTRANPTVTLFPSPNSGNAGSALSYTLTVVNNDNAACTASSFTLTRSVPSGWTGTLGSSSLNIAAGGVGSTTLTVTSSATATAGDYTVSVTATNSGAPGYASSGSAIYRIVPVTTTTTTSTTTTSTTTSTTTTLPSTCAWLTLNPASGLPSYTVTATVGYISCNVCDYQGCVGTSTPNCVGTLIRTGSGAFAAPGAVGTFGYYACPGGGYATIQVTAATTTTTTLPGCPAPSYPSAYWQRVWYAHSTGACLGETPNEPNTQFDSDWATGTVAYSRADDIEFRSSRTINLPTTGTYTFTLGSDDGAKLWIDGTLYIDRWVDRSYTTDSVAVSLSSGNHQLGIDYYENSGGARVSFSYVAPPTTTTTTTTTTIPITTVLGVRGSHTCGADMPDAPVTYSINGGANSTTNTHFNVSNVQNGASISVSVPNPILNWHNWDSINFAGWVQGPDNDYPSGYGGTTTFNIPPGFALLSNPPSFTFIFDLSGGSYLYPVYWQPGGNGKNVIVVAVRDYDIDSPIAGASVRMQTSPDTTAFDSTATTNATGQATFRIGNLEDANVTTSKTGYVGTGDAGKPTSRILNITSGMQTTLYMRTTGPTTTTTTTLPGPVSFQLVIKPGWNLLSVPYWSVSSVQPPDDCGVDTGNFYFYNAATGKWDVKTVGIRSFKGATSYWFYSTKYCNVNVTASDKVVPSDITLSKGEKGDAEWNHVGAPEGGMTLDALHNAQCLNCAGNKCDPTKMKVLYYDTAAGQFKDATELTDEDGRGYRVQCIGS